MIIPYGEWIIFLLTLVSWAENHPSRHLFISLGLAWIMGKLIEGMVGISWFWHLEYSRLAVMIVFFVWAWNRSSRSVFSFLVPSVILMVKYLLVSNEPGVIPLENWLFAGAVLLTAWLTSQSYWGMAASVTGSILISQLFDLFALGGIISHQNLPDPFLWHFGVAGLALSGLMYMRRTEHLPDT
ncbi:MAG: hypothetical protein ACYCVD_07425 [Desulfitobacteriaceae bacterium]